MTRFIIYLISLFILAGATSTKSTTPTVKVNPDAARQAKLLLDLVTAADDIGSALGEFKDKHAAYLPKSALNELSMFEKGLHIMHDEGRKGVQRMSKVGYVLEAYDEIKSEEEGPDPTFAGSNAMWRVKQFIKGFMTPAAKAPTVPVTPSPPSKKQRTSERLIATTTTENALPDGFNGTPPGRDKRWTNETLIAAMAQLEVLGRRREVMGRQRRS